MYFKITFLENSDKYETQIFSRPIRVWGSDLNQGRQPRTKPLEEGKS